MRCIGGRRCSNSALTLIADDRLYYRGRDVSLLAQTETLEQVAALLWTGDAEADALFAARPDAALLLDRLDPALTFAQRMTMALTLASAGDLAAYDLRPDAVARTGARILTLLVSALTLKPLTAGSTADHLARAWLPADPHAARLLDAALILCADHELNVSSFTARVVASAGSTPYAVVTAGLAALSGYKHGGSTERVGALLREIGTAEQIDPVLAARLRRGEHLPGFGHSLYARDPRAETLLALLDQAYPGSAEVTFVHTVAAHVGELIAQPPNVDFALASLELVARLPEGAPLALFALGRTVGWIGHAIEQYAADTLIRPRARYTGDQPNAGA